MKKIFLGLACIGAVMACLGLSYNITNVHAEDTGEPDASADQQVVMYGAGISISPISKIVQLASSSTYEDSFNVTNDSDRPVNFEVYVSPYSYMYSEESDSYTLGFSNENNYTQLTRWTKIMDASGNYVRNPHFSIDGHGKMEIHYRISTPDNMPAGGQYAVIFVHTLADEGGGNNIIKTEASPGMIIYGRGEGESIISAEISDLSLSRDITRTNEEGKQVTDGHINASAKVKNTGNIDFNATATLKVESVFGGGYYETPENKARTSVIPESEMILTDEWENTPWFGLYRTTWTVTAAGETQTISQMIFINPVPFIIITLILLTIIIVWITIMLRKRKERRARLSV